MAETLALHEDSRPLATEYRLKSLDAEMWRSLLHEEALARQHGDEEDEEDDEEYDDDDDGAEDEEEGDQKHHDDADASASAIQDSRHVAKMSASPILTTPARSKSSPTSISEKPTTLPVSSGCLTASPEKNSSLKTIAAESTPLPDDWNAWNLNGMEGGEGEEDEEDEGEDSRVGPDVNMYADYFAMRRHQYRGVISDEFRERVMVCLEDIHAPPSATPILLARSRPLLNRLLMLLPMNDIPTMLELVATKFSYVEAIHLMTPLLVETEEGRLLSLVTISRALDWAIEYDGGKGLPLIIRHHLGLIESPQLLQRMARRAVKYGKGSVPFILRCLTAVPPALYEAEALELARLMGDHWSKEDLIGYGHLLIVRSLQRQPSLSLYFALKKHVLPPKDDGDKMGCVNRVLELMDPSGDLSIGIRLAEGLTLSALDSLSYSLISSDSHRGPKGLSSGSLSPSRD